MIPDFLLPSQRLRACIFGLVLCLASVPLHWQLAAVEPRATEGVSKKPNVLFIAVDDLNDWVGFLGGHPQAWTPHMDRLAKRGMVFTNAHCAAPACNPSRAAVFTGKMPWNTNVWSNRSKKLFQQHPTAEVLPNSFADAGYITLGTGKLMHSGASANKRLFDHHFNPEQRWSPLTKKRVQYTPSELPSKGSDNPRHEVALNGQKIVLPLNRMPSDRAPASDGGESFDWGGFPIEDSSMGDTQITDWAIENIESGFDKPCFLAVGYYRPHIPLWAPAKYFDRFKHQQVQLPAFQDDDLNDLSDIAKRWALEADTAGLHATVQRFDQWRQAAMAYLACTTFVDAQIGRLIDAVDASPMRDSTIIVLWSDHGWHLGEKQHWGKWTPWERSTRVPLLVVPPNQNRNQFAKAGKRCESPVSLIDLYPTLVELCNLQTPGALDGVSLVPLLGKSNHRNASGDNRAVVTSLGPGNVSLRDERFRLIRYSDGSSELYDLMEDPNEWENLAANPEFESQRVKLESKIPVGALQESE
jgi:arylsulfatase A-like enzyme